MNMFALTDLMKLIAEGVSKLNKKPVLLGRYVDISDSFHIYGAYDEEFKGFVSMLSKRDFDERTWSTEFAQPFFEQARKKIETEREDG
jgi:thymidylate synthase